MFFRYHKKPELTHGPQVTFLRLLGLLTLSPFTAFATPDTDKTTGAAPTQAYVSDQLDVALRTGASTGHRIVRFIKSGAPLSVVAHSDNEAWANVILADQTQGWVNARYLMTEPSARTQLQQANAQVESLQARVDASTQALTQASNASASLKQQLTDLTHQHEILTQDHQSLETLCEEAKTISEENLDLREALSDQTLRVNELENINTILRHDRRNEGILQGAIAALIGAMIALLAPRLMRRSNRDVWR